MISGKVRLLLRRLWKIVTRKEKESSVMKLGLEERWFFKAYFLKINYKTLRVTSES